MGGIGKTTLATNVYNSPFIVERFHIRAWITISQEYTVREIFLAILRQISNPDPNEQEKSDDQMGDLLYKKLCGRKYLIVMDDMWNIETWNEVKQFLPSNTNGSRVLVTTRLLNLAVDFGSCSPYIINFLNEEQSWDLLCEKVFAKEGCPAELEEIGKRITKKCGGLPLGLVVIGGLLTKSKKTKTDWEYVEKHVASVVNDGNDEHFMKILSLSYDHLPIHLKPCFLYMAVFPEDSHIRLSRLIRLWVAEGFIKSTCNKTLEEAAEEYLEDLIDRNLILVQKRGSSGKIKTCSIHDLLRDLCTKEAHKHKFLRIANFNFDNANISPYCERRLAIHCSTREENVSIDGLQSTTLITRSVLSYFHDWDLWFIASKPGLLRVLDVVDDFYRNEIQELTNLRCVNFHMNIRDQWCFLSFISQFWNLQTLVIDGYISLPRVIWQMPQLRHIKLREGILFEPLNAHGQDTIVLENLQTLSKLKSFVCSEQVIKRTPNLRKLGITYDSDSTGVVYYGLENLVHFNKLESLFLICNEKLLRNIIFPSSLKKLTLSDCMPWENMSIVGSLPNLEVLKLYSRAAKGSEWNPIEGEFSRLKFLFIDMCELEIWGADNTHFPRLERLVLGRLGLKEIPEDFAEIPTLQVIEINSMYYGNSENLRTSAKKISLKRESVGNEGLQLVVWETYFYQPLISSFHGFDRLDRKGRRFAHVHKNLDI